MSRSELDALHAQSEGQYEEVKEYLSDVFGSVGGNYTGSKHTYSRPVEALWSSDSARPVPVPKMQGPLIVINAGENSNNNAPACDISAPIAPRSSNGTPVLAISYLDGSVRYIVPSPDSDISSSSDNHDHNHISTSPLWVSSDPHIKDRKISPSMVLVETVHTGLGGNLNGSGESDTMSQTCGAEVQLHADPVFPHYMHVSSCGWTHRGGTGAGAMLICSSWLQQALDAADMANPEEMENQEEYLEMEHERNRAAQDVRLESSVVVPILPPPPHHQISGQSIVSDAMIGHLALFRLGPKRDAEGNVAEGSGHIATIEAKNITTAKLAYDYQNSRGPLVNYVTDESDNHSLHNRGQNQKKENFKYVIDRGLIYVDVDV